MSPLEHTEAAAEHTEAAQTQAFRAWSQSGPDELGPVAAHHRRWWLPVGLCVGALVAVAIQCGVLVWGGLKDSAPVSPPRSSAPSAAPSKTVDAAPPSSVAPPPPTATAAPTAPPAAAPPTHMADPGQRFLTLFKSRGGLVEPSREDMVISEGHEVCTRMGYEDENTMIRQMLAGSPGMSRYTAALFADAAIDSLCPQYR